MEKNIYITDNSHTKIYQTYNELKKKLPTKLFKMKVFSSPKYRLDKKPILKRIENEKINSIKQFEKSSSINKLLERNKNIYILSNKTINLKKQKLKPILSKDQKEEDILKKTLLTEKGKDKNDFDIERNQNEFNGYNNYDDYNYDEQYENIGNYGYYFPPHLIKDVHMKANIYLPRIIDRMKYNLPRNEREKNGFRVEGKGIYSNHKSKQDELTDNIYIDDNNKENNKEKWEINEKKY